MTEDTKITVTLGFTKNLGNFESLRVDIGIQDYVRKGETVNDLLPANFIDDGKKIYLIDYEYSGNNDACFELGNIWSEADLPQAALAELVTSYYGESRPEKIARAYLFALLAKYGWSLWARIQCAISEIDFDFWQWGMHRYEFAISAFESKAFQQALVAASS